MGHREPGAVCKPWSETGSLDLQKWTDSSFLGLEVPLCRPKPSRGAGECEPRPPRFTLQVPPAEVGVGVGWVWNDADPLLA